jgi:hypothetical protein
VAKAQTRRDSAPRTLNSGGLLVSASMWRRCPKGASPFNRQSVGIAPVRESRNENHPANPAGPRADLPRYAAPRTLRYRYLLRLRGGLSGVREDKEDYVDEDKEKNSYSHNPMRGLLNWVSEIEGLKGVVSFIFFFL